MAAEAAITDTGEIRLKTRARNSRAGKRVLLFLMATSNHASSIV
jgi:hypothetical protein